MLMQGPRLLDARTELLAVWRRWVANAARRDEGGQFVWGDLSNPGGNAIADTEMLECLLYPQFGIEKLSLEDLEEVDRATARALNPDDASDVVIADTTLKLIAGRLLDYFERHGGDNPKFFPGSYVVRPDDREAYDGFPPVLDAYTLAVSLCIHTKLLLAQWSRDYEDNLPKKLAIDPTELERMADRRLTAALVGLCRCFVAEDIATWKTEEVAIWPGDDLEFRRLRRRLQTYFPSAGRELTYFECGWSWGEVSRERAAQSPRGGALGKDLEEVWPDWPSPPWYAEAAPYLYFTVMAIDGIADLFSTKVASAGVLNRQQLALASHLNVMWEVTWSYWRTIALAPSPNGGWAIEDLPWRTPDGSRSDLWTILLLRIITASPQGRGATSAKEDEAERLTRVIEELAERARVTRRPIPTGTGSTDPTREDPALRLHEPGGVTLALLAATDTKGTPVAPPGEWWAYDAAPQLMKLAGRLMQTTTDRALRQRLTRLIDRSWAHLYSRRLQREHSSAPGYAWDNLSGAYKDDRRGATEQPDVIEAGSAAVGSWYFTERVVESLVAVGQAQDIKPATAEAARAVTAELLTELRWLARERTMDQDALDDLLAAIDKAERENDSSVSAALGKALGIAKEIP